MSETGIIQPSFTAAQNEADRRRGPHMRLKPGRTYRLRLMPSFKSENGEGIWYSVRRKHWKIPVPDTQDFETFACPKELGTQCYICDMADSLRPTLPQMAKDFAPNLSYMFNVIDVDSPQFGVQQLEDGATLFNLMLGIVQALPYVADPVQGQIITVNKLGQSPWRTAIPGAVMSYDELGLEIDIAFPGNLKNLDEVWKYISYEEQKVKFAAIAQNPHQFANTGQQPQLPPVATPVQGFPVEATTVAPGAVAPVSVAPTPAAPAQPVAPVPAAPIATPPAGVTPAAAAPAGSDVAEMQARLEEAANAAGS